MKLTFPALFAGTIYAVGALAADKPIKFDDMPAVVQKAMLKEAKGATIKNTLLEVEDGTTFYEAETVLNGRTRDFLVDAKGNVAEIEDEIEMENVPAPVKAVVEKAASGGGRITKLEEVKKGGAVKGYEATVVKERQEKAARAEPRRLTGKVATVFIRALRVGEKAAIWPKARSANRKVILSAPVFRLHVEAKLPARLVPSARQSFTVVPSHSRNSARALI